MKCSTSALTSVATLEWSHADAAVTDIRLRRRPTTPVLHLDHCDVDRIWAAWQALPGDRGYQPPDTESDQRFRHRPADALFSLFRRDAAGTPWLVRDMFDVSSTYTYDSPAVG